MKYDEFKHFLGNYLINNYQFKKTKTKYYKEFPKFILLILIEKSLFSNYYKVMYNYIFKELHNDDIKNIINIWDHCAIMGCPDLQCPQDIFSKELIEKNSESKIIKIVEKNFNQFLQNLDEKGLKYIKTSAKNDKTINVYKPEAVEFLKSI